MTHQLQERGGNALALAVREQHQLQVVGVLGDEDVADAGCTVMLSGSRSGASGPRVAAS